jgi:hypothetical protein
MSDMISMVWREVKADIDALRQQNLLILTKLDRSETTGGISESTLANAPLAVSGGVKNGDLLWISNGRKSGEGVGVGTGVPAYYNVATDTWKRFEDNADVTV